VVYSWNLKEADYGTVNVRLKIGYMLRESRVPNWELKCKSWTRAFAGLSRRTVEHILSAMITGTCKYQRLGTPTALLLQRSKRALARR